MTASLHGVATLAWREGRNTWRRLLLFMSSISLGVAALVAIDSYSANVRRSVREQSRAILGADLSLSSRTAFDSTMERLLDSLRGAGIPVARQTSFLSMVSVPRTAGARLAQIRAVEPGYPFYGAIQTQPAGRWRALHDERQALVDPALLVALDARVGDSLTVGFTRFEIAGAVTNVPGDVGVTAAFGPRVFVPARFLEETRLLGFGSRAEYEAFARFADGDDPQRFIRAQRERLDSARVRARTVEDTERNLTESVADMHRFLGLVGLVALLLGGIGIASAVHAYVRERTDTAAILRCLGASGVQVLAIYVIEAALMGLVGAAAGVILGIGAQFLLPGVLGEFMPVDVALRLEPRALGLGLAVGVSVATLFALRPMLALRRVSPLQALRRDVDPATRRRLWRDRGWLAVTAALALSVVGIAVARAGELIDGLAMSAAIGAAIVVLYGSATLLSWGARRALRQRWPFVLRQGIANLYRPANQTRAIMLSLGFGAFLISTLYLVQSNLLHRLTLSGRASQANLAFFDVQDDQLRGLDSIVRSARLPVLQRVPIVPMRVAELGGRTVQQILADTGRRSPRWALRREYRSSYRDTLVASERLTAGRWFDGGESGGGDVLPSVSMERELAGELGVTIGDTIVWDVQGVRIATRVANLREVNWARFEPNFFVVFEPGVLERAPQSHVLLTQASDAMARARLQRQVVDRFPNISSIDLALIQEALQRILARVSLAIRFMALFSVATGVIVLVSAVTATRRQRIREGVLLKTLGATRRQIRRILCAEYAVLGLLASLTGMLLSIAGGWALMRFMFEAPFSPALLPVLGLAGAIVLLTVAVGLFGGRDVFAETPMAALREA